MTLDERVEEAVGAIVRRVGRLELDRIVRESITAAVAEEREACAQIAERETWTGQGIDDLPELTIARKIRARSDEKPP